MFEELRSEFEVAGQGHVLAFAEGLSVAEQERLFQQLRDLDLEAVTRLEWSDGKDAPVASESLSEPPVLRPDEAERARLEQVGRAHLAAGKVAVLTVAGGDGTRLGFDGPKGAYPISPVFGASLYRLFAEGIVAARRRSGAAIPWILMTSAANDEETREHLDQFSGWLGVGDGPGYRTMIQGTRPVLDLEGRLLLAARDRLVVAPDGHGGAVAALARSGLLAELLASGVNTLFYHQVDNPLGRRPDPVLIGAHVEARAEATVKVVAKTEPDEEVGVVCLRGGRPAVVEYTELGRDRSHSRTSDNRLRFAAANIAVHTFDLEFLVRAAADELPVHRALKKVPHVDASGCLVSPAEPNALKFESFIFDLLPRASSVVCLEVERASEFHPLKKQDGEFSEQGVKLALTRWWGSWLAARGLPIPSPAKLDGSTAIDISPLCADDATCLRDDLELECDEQGRIVLTDACGAE